ncbi:MAG TPA: ATP-binding protein [Thermoanaerobaculia bacterium]|jgi:PAS domain S-box-containing protein
MASSSLPWALIAIILIVLAIVIFRRQRASRVAVLFCAMIVLVAVWFGGFAVMFASGSSAAAKIALAGVALLPAAIYDFTATALRVGRRRETALRAVWGASSLFAIVALATSLMVGSVEKHDWGYYPLAGKLLPLFLIFFVGVLVAQLVEGIKEWQREADAKRKKRIARLLLAFIVVYIASVDFAPMFGVNMRPIGYIPVLAFMIIAWTSILHHRLPPITAARAAREILDTMADALFVIDADGRIRVVNGAVTHLLGFKDAELLGRSIDTLEVTESEQTISRTLRDLVRKTAIRDQERSLRQKDSDEPVAVSISISPVTDGDVQQGAVLIARDIRERKDAESELHEAMRRLEQSNRELEDFAYVASHDLQEPLRKIQAFGDRLQAKYAADLPEQGQDYVARMQSAAKRMQVLINDLLAFSRVTTKAQPFVPVDLEHVAREVAHDLEIRTHEAGAHVEIGALPAIDADPLQMRQLLQNLISNALKFHREGVPPLITISGSVDGDRAQIVVADNGIGFEEKYAERIFTMFERLHGRGTYEGTGIGLAICRKIVERHGGEIVAHGEPGVGSTFTATLPVHHAHEHHLEKETLHA